MPTTWIPDPARLARDPPGGNPRAIAHVCWGMERERPDTAAGMGVEAVRAAAGTAERDRPIGSPRATDRPAAFDEEGTRQSLTPEHWAEIRLAIDRALGDRRISDLRRRQRAAVRRHLATVRALRRVTVPAIGLAALLPFAAHAWGDGRGLGGAPKAFAASGPGARPGCSWRRSAPAPSPGRRPAPAARKGWSSWWSTPSWAAWPA
jgi:hypothetical protein